MTEQAETVAPPSAAPASIELHGIEKAYSGRGDHVAAVRGVDLRIEEGEFFSLLGPSGCGKSTTLRMIAGFERPSSGRVLLQGNDVTDLGPHRRDVNMVFQNYALFPHLDVWNNIAFGLRRRRVAKAEIARRVGEIVDVVELSGREHRMPRELSGGQQQRVALARALVNRPRALLLDEPLGALDLQLRQTMQIELKRIQREVGITFVYVTHDQSEALTMSDRIAVMHDGVIEQCADARTVYERPSTPFVAQFIGTSNLFPVAAGDLGPGDAIDVRDGADVVSVRPERITLTAAPPATGTRIVGTVAEIVYLGASVTTVVRTDPLHRVVVVEPATAAPRSLGDRVWLTWAPETAAVFPSA